MNKCADNAKDEKLKTLYLTNLKSDIEADKIILEENVKAIEDKIKTASEILPKLNTNAADKMSIVGKVFDIVSLNNFTPNDNTYQTLINSGDFKLINDFNTKKAIEEHYSICEAIQKDYLRVENIQKQYVGDYFIHNIDYDDFSKGQFGFEDEKLLKNIIMSMRGAFDLKLKATQKGLASCDSLITVIQKML
tara:strand:- start:53 stop:628 length:576 start_codon:yes stop_codon:yes gene_type:complete